MTTARTQDKAERGFGGGTSQQEIGYRFGKRQKRDRKELLDRIVRNLSSPTPSHSIEGE